jgi:hypothetical protein
MYINNKIKINTEKAMKAERGRRGTTLLLH